MNQLKCPKCGDAVTDIRTPCRKCGCLINQAIRESILALGGKAELLGLSYIPLWASLALIGLKEFMDARLLMIIRTALFFISVVLFIISLFIFLPALRRFLVLAATYHKMKVYFLGTLFFGLVIWLGWFFRSTLPIFPLWIYICFTIYAIFIMILIILHLYHSWEILSFNPRIKK